MAKNYFLNQVSHLRKKAKFLNFMIMQIKKSENEGSNEKKSAGKEQGQD